MNRSEAKTIWSTFWDAFLPNNVVLVQATGICPILAVGYTLKNAMALSVCTAAVLLPMSLLLTALGNRIDNRLRPALYTGLSSLLLLGCAFVLRQAIDVDVYASLYVFLPLMAVNSLFTYRAGNVKTSLSPAVAAADALGSALGFALVLCVAGGLRELAVSGTLWDRPVGLPVHFPEAKHPFIGFLLLSFMAATLQWSKQLLRRAMHRDEEVAVL